MALNKAVDILKRTQDGREALLEAIESYGGFTSLSSNDPIEQARLVARRQVAADIMQCLLTDDLDAFTIMMKERNIRLQVNRAKDKEDD